MHECPRPGHTAGRPGTVPSVPDEPATFPPYDEFGLFHENAAEFGLPYDGPPLVRREDFEVAPGQKVSALIWGDGPPEFVLVHGGAQNAHTWDTVAMALNRPLVAVDLPGHGHSDAGTQGSISAQQHARDVAAALRAITPGPVVLVGMSLGGLTAIALCAHDPDLVRRLALVDVTPGVQAPQALTDFIDGPPSFPNFDELLARTIQFNPTRSESSLRRGILHNAVPREDGTWVWRYARFRPPEGATRPEFGDLWADLGAIEVPVMLVRGMATGSVVTDENEAELRRRLPSARIEHVEGAGHSVQGDRPIELAALLADFAGD
jgi:pimeloyl-ACP methyl ester carboxylesterase